MRPTDFLDAAETYLERLKAEGMTGKLTFTLDLKDGGIGRVGVNIDHDLKAPTPGPQAQRGETQEQRGPRLHSDGTHSKPLEGVTAT
jgi:hypothetical protein